MVISWIVNAYNARQLFRRNIDNVATVAKYLCEILETLRVSVVPSYLNSFNIFQTFLLSLLNLQLHSCNPMFFTYGVYANLSNKKRTNFKFMHDRQI